MAEPIQIPGNLLVPTMIPLDAKVYFKTLLDLANLGPSNSNAFKYYAGMLAFCLETKKFYMWMERPVGYTENGVLNADFIYPTGLVVDGINYANKHYNFFDYMQYYLATNQNNVQLAFKYKPGFYKVMNNDEMPLPGNFYPLGFDSTGNTPYKVKGKINQFYTERETPLDYQITLADNTGSVIAEFENAITLPAYPGEFETPVHALPPLIVGPIYTLTIRTQPQAEPVEDFTYASVNFTLE